MINLIIVIALVAIAAYAAYSAKTPTGWDIKKGLMAVVALIVAAWAYVTGLFQTPPV